MIRTIIYFHGFASSSDSDKAKIFQKYISSLKNDIDLIIPDLSNNFYDSVDQIKQIIKSNQKPIAFMGSSLGGYYAAYFSSKHNSKAVLINPAIPPLEGFDIYLGENKNYATGERFVLKKDDIDFIRSISNKKYNNQKNTLLLLESGDEVLNYIKTLTYFKGSFVDIVFGGNHSYESLDKKLEKIKNFLEI
tara:strand:- start:4642 stop:5214 length:573 start_codon:yes stop_codon:yes gene_type:complete